MNVFYFVFYEWYEKYGVCKYGVYGMSYCYVVFWVVEMFGKLLEDLKLIIFYIGVGVLIMVIKNGKFFDILMGFFLLVGVMMVICLGDVDLFLVVFV